MTTRACHHLLVRIVAFVAVAGPAGSDLARSHVDSSYLTDECGSCHVGHGASGEPMLDLSEEEFCYQCHGAVEARSEMIARGWLLPGAPLSDVEREFQKSYRHPVVEGVGHVPDERLPSLTGESAAHAECVDCHNPHERVTGLKRTSREVPGFSISGQHVQSSSFEYEMCLKCHSEPLGLGAQGKQLRREFAMAVESQHPVTVEPSGRKLPSLARVRPASDRMTCSECHASDDPDAPRGPHGSNHRFLLSGNYTLDPEAQESPYAYEFCYSCHDRSSILANESFTLHREHIEGDPLAGRPGTSCHTCHASHGSRDAPHLLQFNPQAVEPETLTRLLEYRDLGDRSGECYLSCHGHDHVPGRY